MTHRGNPVRFRRGTAAEPTDVDWTIPRQTTGSTTGSSTVRTLLVVLAVLTPVAALGAWAVNAWDEGHRETGSRAVSVVRAAADPAPTASLLTEVRVRRDGTLQVSQRIRSSEPLTTMLVAAPVDPYLRHGTVTATDLEVEAAGKPVPGQDEVTLDSAVFSFDETKSVRLRYLLSGALQRTDGSTRALARVTSMDLFLDVDLMPATYVFRGAHILNLACTPAASGNEPLACGAQHGQRWEVRIAQPGAKLNRVMVQLDLAPAVS